MDSNKRPINHGTDGGYMTHRNRGEQPCKECTAAHNEYCLKRYKKKRPKRLRVKQVLEEGFSCYERTAYYPHGKRGKKAGYNTHLRNGEEPCDACKLAMQKYGRKKKPGRPKKRRRTKPPVITADQLQWGDKKPPQLEQLKEKSNGTQTRTRKR